MALSDAEIAFVEALLRDRAGLELTRWLVEARVEARMLATRTDADAYIARLRSDGGGAELAALIEAVRVGETRFFRHQSHVDALRDVVVPAWKMRGLARPRVWSAGCASGEEAYTLALILEEAMPAPAFHPEILATDVSRAALDVAAAGRYPRGALAHVPTQYQGGFDADGESIVVRAHVRRLVTFREENLATNERVRRLDLVWCRNVLIYFDAEARARVLKKLVGALAPGGFLFLGYSETLRDVPGLRAVPWQGQLLWERDIDGDPRRSSTSEVGRASSVPASSAAPRSRLTAEEGPPRAARGRPSTTGGAATFRLSVSTGEALAAPLDAALRAPGLVELTLDLDAASFLDDDVAPVLRRAWAKATASGVRLVLRATRAGPQRWLRRHGFGDGPGDEA